MNEGLAKIIEPMLIKIETLRRIYSVADELAKFKLDQCLEIECRKCVFHSTCGYIHKFLSYLNEMAIFHIESLENLLVERMGELRSDAEEKGEGWSCNMA